MEVDLNDVRSGKLDGQYLYISDYHQGAGASCFVKPRRHIKPQRVYVRSNHCESLKTRKNKPNSQLFKRMQLLSKSHFVCLNKNGELAKKVITAFTESAPFVSGIFTTKLEAWEYYMIQRNYIKWRMLAQLEEQQKLLLNFETETEKMQQYKDSLGV